MNSEQRTQTQTASVVSDSVYYPGRSGLKIAAFFDHPAEDFEGLPFVVMAPKYGETKKNNLKLAYSLAANGMNVLRFDHTCHVGESAGPRTGFTLASGADDILGSIDFLERQHGAKSCALIASSLSARTAIRATALDPRVNQLVCVVGVVNVQHTLRSVYREDLVANCIAGKQWGVTDILGHDIDFDAFLRSAIENDLHDLQGTARDLEHIDQPMTFFSAEDDTWVDVAEVESVLGSLENRRVVRLKGVKHEVRENPEAAEEAFREIINVVANEPCASVEGLGELRQPEKRGLLQQNRFERDRLRVAAPKEETETAFWSEYLAKYCMLERVGDYQDYLSLVGGLLGPFKPGETVLDAGCGNGMAGGWLLKQWSEAVWDEMPPTYVAVDLSDSGLRAAVDRHADLVSPARSGSLSAGTVYGSANFDAEENGRVVLDMPRFADGTFDAICCSLVVSYLRDPALLMAELRRVIRPGGRIIVSSMKPHCDMSVIYRDFVDEQVGEEDIASARTLLTAAGKIKLKQEQGYYTFYSAEDIEAMMLAAGLKQTRQYRAFGDQAVVVRATA